jgi:hypothetical protein
MRRSLPILPLAALLVGCFTDYAPNTTNDLVGPSADASSTGPPRPPVDDTTSGTTGTTTGATGTSSTTSTTGPLVDSDVEPGTSSTSSATTLSVSDLPAHDIAECLANTRGLDCAECVCDSCIAEFFACSADPGCVAIEQCAFAVGCDGAGCIGPCGDVIDHHGGVDGPSVALAEAFSDCLDDHCAC